MTDNKNPMASSSSSGTLGTQPVPSPAAAASSVGGGAAGAPSKKPKVERKDTDRDWTLTFSNLMRVAMNFRKEHDLKTDDLGVVLQLIGDKTKWIPSPAILRNGIDDFYFEQFKARCNGTEPYPWWERKRRARTQSRAVDVPSE